MSVWASQMGNNASNDDEQKQVNKYYYNVVTDVNGQFEINLDFGDITVIGANAFVVNQTLSIADNVNNKVDAKLVQISDTIIKGVAVVGNIVTGGIGVTIAPLKRAASGIDIRVVIECVNN